MDKIQVVTVDIYTSKKTGKQSYKITGLCEHGVVVFYRPLEDQTKKGDIYIPTIQYSSYKMAHVCSYKKA